MNDSVFMERRRLEQLTPQQLASHQIERLNHLLSTILPQNQFYNENWAR